jgi:AraC-like DNA-binding protein
MDGDVDMTFEFAHLPQGGHAAVPAMDRAIFYQVRCGSIRLKPAGHSAVEISEGECASLPVGDAHTITALGEETGATRHTLCWHEALAGSETEAGQPGKNAVLFRSTISLSANAYPGLLPKLVLIDHARLASFPGLSALVTLFQQTVDMPPRFRVMAQPRLAELIATAIDIVGLADMEEIIPKIPGQDGRMRRTLEKIHGSPEAPWSLEVLAKAAGASRSAFVAHFKETVGDTPLGYITKLRMYKAARLLRTGDSSLSDVAARMGYTTDASFSKAFTRVIGVPPGRFRSGSSQMHSRRSKKIGPQSLRRTSALPATDP